MGERTDGGAARYRRAAVLVARLSVPGVLATGLLGGCGSDLDSESAGADAVTAAALVEPADLGGPDEWRVAHLGDDVPPDDLTAMMAARCADPASYDRGGHADDTARSAVLEAVPERSAFWASEGPAPFTGLVRTGVAEYPDADAAAAAVDEIESGALRACIGEQVDAVVAHREAVSGEDDDWPVAPPEAIGDMGRVTPTIAPLDLGDEGLLVETLFDASVVGGFDHTYAADLAVIRRGDTVVFVSATFDSQGIEPDPVAAAATEVARQVLARVDRVLADDPLPSSTTVDPAEAARRAEAAVAAMAPTPGGLPGPETWTTATTTAMAECVATDRLLGSPGDDPPVAVAAPTSITRPGAELVVSGAVYRDRESATEALSTLSSWVQCPLWEEADTTGYWGSMGRPMVGDDAMLMVWQAQPTAAPGTARGAYDLLALRQGRALVVVAAYEDLPTPAGPSLEQGHAGSSLPSTGSALGGAVLDQGERVAQGVADAVG